MSHRRSYAVTLAAALAVMLGGCGDKTPSCADPATVSLVQQIYQQSFDKEHASMSPERQRRVQFTSNDTKVTVEAITTASTDEATGKKTCSAVLSTVMPQDTIPTDQRMLNHLRGIYEPQGAALDGRTVKGNVTYTVQRTEDSKDVLVKLTGHLAFMGLFHDLAMLRVFDKSEAEFEQMTGAAPKAAEAKTADSPPPEPEPVSQQAPSAAPPVASSIPPAMQPATAQAPAALSLQLLQSAFRTCARDQRLRSSRVPPGGNALRFAAAALVQASSWCTGSRRWGGAPEMEYPSGGAAAAAAFQHGAQTAPDGKPVRFLSFDKGNYRYVVYANEGGDSPRQGILVEQGGKRIADLRCQSDAMSSFNAAQFQKMGLSQDSRGISLP